jgi:hypothetical protein
MLGRFRGRLVGLLGVLPHRGWWIEELTAEILQQSGSGGDIEAAPAAGGPVEYGPDKDTQLVSPGSRPMTLTRRRVSPKVRSMKLEWRMRCQCSRGKRS